MGIIKNDIAKSDIVFTMQSFLINVLLKMMAFLVVCSDQINIISLFNLIEKLLQIVVYLIRLFTYTDKIESKKMMSIYMFTDCE